MKILELCRERGRVSVGVGVGVGEIERLTGANRNTVKDHLVALTKNKHLTRRGARRVVFTRLSWWRRQKPAPLRLAKKIPRLS